MAIIFRMTEEQIQILTNIQEQSRYPDAYRYVRDISSQAAVNAATGAQNQELNTVATWMDRAASINANDGSFSSEFVRGATEAMGAINDISINDNKFQETSNQLAHDVIQKIIDGGGIPTAKSIIAEDVRHAVKDFQLPQWGWAGTIGDILPTTIGGLGVDFVSLPTTDARAMGEAYAKAIAANGYGMGRWITSQLPNPFSSAINLANLSGDYDQLGNFISNLQTQFQAAKTTVSPLILDLDGDGIETLSKSLGIHFDHDGNQFAETTGWVGKDDGLLVWDRNGNGRIDDGSELFGNNTLLGNDTKATNGFTALAELDSNYDNKIDASDTAFSQLRLWKDTDSDALLCDGELLSLDTGGVQSFNLAYQSQTLTDAQGNQHLQVGSYLRTDGSSAAMDDVWFAADTALTIDQNIIDIDEEIAALPDLQGFGNVHSLHQAMARDQSGKLKELVQAFSSENGVEGRRALLQDILFEWTGSSGYAVNSRGGYIGDARKLYALEAFLGEHFIQEFRTNDPEPNASETLMTGFENLSQMLYGQLMLQMQYKNLCESIQLTWNSSSATFKIDVSAVVTAFQTAYEKNTADGLYLNKDFGVALKLCGNFGKDVLESIRKKGDRQGSEFSCSLASIGKNYFSGSDGNDIIFGDIKNGNSIFGFGGSDKINGGNADDILCGGSGNDFLSGGMGNDSYLFSIGDGIDSISDYEFGLRDSDVVKLMNVISSDHTELQRVSNDLILKYSTADQLTVSNYFSSAEYHIEQFIFADGVSWDDEAIKARVMTMGTVGTDYIVGYDDGTNRIFGFDGNDILFGSGKGDSIEGGNGNDSIYGGAGNDILLGGDGDDLLDTGIGNDVMDGGSGNDTYLLDIGGTDRIFESGGGFDVAQLSYVASTKITAVERRVNDLELSYGEAAQLTISNYFGNASFCIEKFSFADGVSWDDTTIKARVMTIGTGDADLITGLYDSTNRIFGFDGNDILYGGSKDDQLDGGNGDDSLYGYAGNNTLTGGMGNDSIYSGAGNDSLLGGHGDDLLDAGTGNDVMDGGSGNDTYILHAAGVGQISIVNDSDKIQFADVASNDITAIERNVLDLVLKYGESGQLTVKNYFAAGAYSRIEQFTFSDGMRWKDVKVGMEGNDSLVGDAGNNVFIGSTADEHMAGGSGNDTYFFSKGDGIDRINDFDEKSGNHDMVQFLNVSSIEITNLQRLSNDLVFHYGTSDQLIVSNYFEDKNNQIEKFNFSDGVSWDEAVINSKVVTAGKTSDLYQWGYHDDMNLLSGSEGGDVLVGSLLDDLMEGGDGDDNLSGKAGHDLLVGGAGDDILFGGDDSDVLEGGAGNDLLGGGSGSDLYLFASGDGSDSIGDFDTTTGNHDKVLFADMASTEINSLQKLNNDLVISFGKSDQLTVSNYFTDPNYQIEEFSFGDGISWDDAAIKARVMMLGTAASDAIRGLTMSTNRIAGLDGNDALYGGVLDDVLDGGKGNDYLSGSSGNDTYLFAKGDGIDSISESGSRTSNSDTIKFTDISAGEVTALQRSGNNLVIQYGSSDQITVDSYFYDEAYEVEQFVFSDGEVWDGAAFNARIMTIGTSNIDIIFGYADATNHLAGNDGNDLLSGGNGNDVIEGGNGNDFIFGGAGNDEILTGEGFDVIAFNRGHGHDTVVDSSGQDNTLSLGKGISSADLTLSKFGNDLILSTGIDGRVTLKDWYESTIKHSIKTLQIVTPTETGYGFQTSAPVQQFDFSNIVNAYDQKRAENEIADAWALVAAMKDNQLGGSSWNAIGGYVANEFASDKNSADMSLYSLQNSLSSSQFGQSKELVVSFSSPRAWY